MAEDPKKLERSKRVIIREITSLKAVTEAGIQENASIDNVNRLLTHLESWRKALDVLKGIDNSLLDLIDDSKTPAEILKLEEAITKDRFTLMQELNDYLGSVKTIKDSLEDNRPTRRSMLNSSFLDATLTNPTIKIQDMPVPKFDGKIQNFPDWYNEFESMFDKNENLDNFQKLYLLKRAMVGDAETILKDYTSDPTMYPLAIAHIKKIFLNKRRIISGHFAEIMDLPIVKMAQLRESLEKIQRSLRGLSVCGINTKKLSPLITFIVSRKLPEKIRIDWENSQHDYSTYPSFDLMYNFLINRCFAYETVNPSELKEKVNSSSSGKRGKSPVKPTQVDKRALAAVKQNSSTIPSNIKCVVCGESHYLNQCKQFSEKSIADRFSIVKLNRLCLKCFNPFHGVSACKRPNCTKCQGSHNTLLHRIYVPHPSVNSNSETNTSSPQQQQQQQQQHSNSPPPTSGPSGSTSGPTSASMCATSSTRKCVLLSTAVVKVVSGKNIVFARVIFDQGSEISLVTRDFCERAKLPILKSENETSLVGINNTCTKLNSGVRCVLKSRFSNFSIAIDAEVIAKVPCSVNKSDVKSIVDKFPINFAENFELPYNNVDILLGSEYVEFILKETRHFYEGICLRDSHFGFVISGSFKTSFLAQKLSSFCGLSNTALSEQFNRFWQIENSVDSPDSKTEILLEHKMIKDHFDETYSRDVDGRFVLRLPVKPSIVNLHGSFYKAKTMLLKSERRKSDIIQKAYATFMSEYEQLGHMSKLSNVTCDFEKDNVYFIPHHMVTKESSSTTKFRVVFNASCNDKSNTSLNDHLLDGPFIQPELFTNVITFREFIYAYAADIAHMYRQIIIHKDDRKWQRIIWRSNSTEPIEIFDLNTLTYGTKPATFMATYCLEKVALSIEHTYPKVAHAIRKHFYVDNAMSGANSVEEAIELQKLMHSTLEKFGFPLRKYMSNSPEILKQIDSSLIEPLNSRILGGDPYIYVLGVVWYPDTDTLSVNIELDDMCEIITKRTLLSDTSKIFDVLGILAPVTITAKILIKTVWKEGREWDEEVSSDLKNAFLEYRRNLILLKDYSIPRCYFTSKRVVTKQLIGFADASMLAYAAVVYLRAIDEQGKVNITFICSKSRVSPSKDDINIHRLELMAAELLSKLIGRLGKELSIEKENFHVFSDSKVALSWISTDPIKLKLFVSNRVKSICNSTLAEQWHYVETKSNPADLATRGISANLFLCAEIWRVGPSWLCDDVLFRNYVSHKPEPIHDLPEIRREKVTCSFVSLQSSTIILSEMNKLSSFLKLVSVVGYLIRYVRNLKKSAEIRNQADDAVLKVEKRTIKMIENLSLDERNDAYHRILRASQIEFFEQEYSLLYENKWLDKENQKSLPNKSMFFSLNVFLDKNNLIRVKGRLSAAEFSDDTKYPIILSAKSKFVEVYLWYIHLKYFHASKQFMFNFIRARFWIIGNLASLVKKIVRQCVICVRINAECVQQFMSDLPKERTIVARPFTTTGVDLSGAISVKCTNHRVAKYNKMYLVFFVCFSTRAVHVDFVEDLTAEAFLNTLERFCSRRGIPKLLYSDNGTNFVGLKNIIENSKFESFTLENSIEWRMIAPRSPHQGGLWEASVKAGKKILLKAVGQQTLTLVELVTILSKVEAILNSRPLTYKFSNEFVEPLTPGHFLIGSGLFELPIAENSSNINLKSRYRLWRRIVDSFWAPWRKNYLNQLQNRNKWRKRVQNLAVNDVVLISNKNESVMSWPMAIVDEVFVGRDSLVRTVILRLPNNVKRKTAVQNLVKLPVNNVS